MSVRGSSSREAACSRLSQVHDEPLAGAAPAEPRAWVLLEHPGPWSPRLSDAASVVPARVRQAVEAHGLRLQLIRRHGKQPPGDGHACYLGYSAYDRGWLEHRRLGELSEVLAADLAAVAEGRAPGFGEPVADPVALVCTHGARDACCAELGRPVAAALAAADLGGAAVWESSHVGGHRFAANLVVLPRGLHYGRLSPAQGPTAVREAAHGRVVPEALRGRPGQAPPVQAAEAHVRRLDGLAALDALSVNGCEETTPNERVVALASATYGYRVRVRAHTGRPRFVSCGDETPEAPPVWLPVELLRVPLERATAGGLPGSASPATGDEESSGDGPA